MTSFKKVSLQLTKLTFAGLMSLYFMPQANAQTEAAPPAKVPSVFKTCAEQNGLQKGVKPTDEQREAMHACVKTAVQAARTECAAQAGVTLPAPGSGQKLSKDDWQKMRACMESKGVRRHRHHRHHKNANGNASEAAPAAAPAPAAQ